MTPRGGRLVQDSENIRAKLAARVIVGDDGEPLFTQQDVAALGELSGAALDRIWDVAVRLSGLNQAALDELSKNSGGDLSEDSASA